MSEKFDAFPEMVRVHGGSFLMGSPASEAGRADSEGPLHQVRINYAFALSKCPVTFAEWDAAIAAGAKLHAPDDQGWGRGQHPAVNVSWSDAQAYIAWLNKMGDGRYRLPSEAEWEYACRAGSGARYPHGDDDAPLADHAWSALNSENRIQPVGMLRPNSFGLHDMLGNMWEWCEDTWHDSYRTETSEGFVQTAPTDGSAWSDGGDPSCRTLRGGSWDDAGPQVFRSADRCGGQALARMPNIGFRIAQTLKP